MDPNLLYGRIAEIAPEWDPFPVLQQMDQMPPPGVGQQTMAPQSAYGWANPDAAPTPQLPQSQQPPAVQMMPQGGAQGATPQAAPMSPQQMMAIAQMSRGPGQGPRAPMVAPAQGGKQKINFQPVPMPQPAMGQGAPPGGFASLFGRR